MAPLAEAFIRLRPETAGFDSETERKIGKIEIKVPVTPDVAKFRAELQKKVDAMPAVKAAVSPKLAAGFRRDLQAQIDAMANLKAKVDASLDKKSIADLKADLKSASGLKVKVEASLDKKSVSALKTELKGVTGVTAKIDVDIADAMANIATVQGALAALHAPRVNVDVDNAAALAHVAAVQAALSALHSSSTTVNVGGSTGSAARAGAADAGAYATAFRTGIEAALRNLPTPTISVATGPAEQSVRDLHASLTRLASERFGVTITGEQAHRELAQIRADIERLRASGHLGVDVDANVRAAELALTRLEAQLAEIGRDRTARVDVDTGGSYSRLGLLITAITTIGPAAIPAGAAASAALVSIGNAALVGVSGVGVLALALSGVIGGVKALSQAHEQAAKSQLQVAKADVSAANSADQVRSAVASLANTRANAAESARKAAESIANAERTLAGAQRDSLAAQKALTTAREEAKQALEDLGSQVAGNALDIRRANLELADTQKALAAVQSLPVDNRARVEAQLAYDEAKQHLSDLTVRQGRLATEKAAADKAGIDGSKQVLAAQKTIADAQEKVRDAERGVADARIAAAEQARQSAFSIAQAQQAVVQAQKSAAQSLQKSMDTAGTATDELRQKLAALSPAGRQFSEFIFGLKDDFLSLRQAAETGFLPGLQRGIQSLLAYEPNVTAFVSKVATALGDLSEQGAKALGGSEWRRFFTYLDNTAVPTLITLARSAGNVAQGFASIVVAFAPFTTQFNAGLVGVTKRFAEWSDTLSENRGFRDFLAYVEGRGPQALNTLGAAIGAVTHLLQGIAPVGDVVLSVLRGVSAVIDAIPVPVITAAYAAFVSWRVANLIVSGLTTVISGLTSALSGLGAISTSTATSIRTMAAYLSGPVTVALAIAAVGVSYLIQQQAKHEAQTKSNIAALGQFADAAKRTGGIFSEQARQVAAQNPAVQDLVLNLGRYSKMAGDLDTQLGQNAEAARAYGVDLADLSSALSGNADAQQRVLDVLATVAALSPDKQLAKEAGERRAELEKLFAQQKLSATADEQLAGVATTTAARIGQVKDEVKAVSSALQDSGVTAEGYKSAITALGDVTGDTTGKLDVLAGLAQKIGDSQLAATQKAELFNSILQSIGQSATIGGPKFEALEGVFTAIGESSLDARTKVNLLKQAMDDLYGAAISQTEAEEALVSSQAQLSTQLASNKYGFDLTAAAARGHTEEVKANRDALEAALQALREKYVQDIANGVAEDQARASYEKSKQALLNQLPPLSLNSQAVQDLINRYGAIPAKKETSVSAPGLDKAIEEMVNAHAVQIGLSMKPPWTKDQIMAEVGYLANAINGRFGQVAMFKADGGMIPGFSPHSKADNIPAMLTAHEFVQPVSAVKYYGPGVMEAMRRRQIPREAFVGGYASGGFVGQRSYGDLSRMPLTIPSDPTRPNLSDLWRQYDEAVAAWNALDEFSAGLLSVGDAGTTGGSESIKAFIRHADSLPYIFGAAGPNAYDCCLPGRTLIHGPHGPKRIDEVQAGDMVYSRADDGELVERKVVKAWRSIDQMTFRLKVRGRNIDASANHPFLRVRSERVKTTGGPCETGGCTRPARGRGLCATCYARLRRHGKLPENYSAVTQYHLEWVRLDELRRDDIIVVLDEAPDSSTDDAPILPDGTAVTERLAWLLGAIVGDGTVTQRSIRVAAFDDFQSEVKAAFAETLGLTAYPHHSAGLIVNSSRYASMLHALGFWRRGSDKRVPEIVWSWPRHLRLAFCAGYAAADGWWDPRGGGGQRYDSCSRRLLDEVRTIHLEAGHRVSNVSTNRRVKPITIKGKRVKNAKPLYNFVVSSTEREPYVWVKDGGAAAAGHALTGGAFGLRRVLGVEGLEVEPTYDLNIDENHNFIADGVVVHNSGITGAVYGLMLGLANATSRRFFTTYDFRGKPPAGFKPGVGGTYTVGVNPETHMAGEYGGLKFEAANSRSGIKVGPSAKNVRTFQKQFHLASGGLVDPALLAKSGVEIGGDPSGMTVNGKRVQLANGGMVLPARRYDTGGEWPNNTIGINTSGRTEHVTTGDGMDRVESKLDAMLDRLDTMIRAVERAADRTVDGFGKELRGASRTALSTARARGPA